MATSRRARPDVAETLERVLAIARADDFEGYSKHDALNAAWLERLAGDSRPRRLVATQAVMRSPVDLRGLLRVRKARNPKGLSLFARALLARNRRSGSDRDAEAAIELLDWLVAHPAPALGGDLPGLAWGYPYPWQDVGFFAPRHFPNRVVTAFVGQALLDGVRHARRSALPRRRHRSRPVPPPRAEDPLRRRKAAAA